MKEFIEIRQLMAIVIRRWPILLAGVALGVMLGAVISQRQAPVYRATAVLVVGQSIQTSAVDSRDIQLAEELAPTYAEVARRQPLLQATVEALGLDVSWQQLREQVRVSPIAGTQLLEVIAEAGSPLAARDVAEELARQLVLMSASGSAAEDDETSLFLRERLDSLKLRIEDGQRRVEALEAAMAGAPNTADLRSLQDQVDVLEGLITGWESNYAQLLALVESEETGSYLSLIGPAQLSPSRISPRTSLNMLIGSVLGFTLALGVVLLLGYLDDRIRTADDLMRDLRLPPLGAVSKLAGEGYEHKLIADMDHYAPATEAYNVIRSNIRFASQAQPARSILVTSALAGEGKSLTAANLGMAMARLGLQTVIVDTDLRRPAQHQIFGKPNDIGVAQMLTPKAKLLKGKLQQTKVPGLLLLSSGAPPDNPAELVSSASMDRLIAQLVDDFEFDIVILDAPPVLTAADAAVLSSKADAVLLVVQSGRTGRRVAQQAIAALQQAGARILGAVLNQAPPRAHNYYYAPYAGDENGRPNLKGTWQTVAQRWRNRETTARSNGHYESEPVSSADS
jgi:non-specific protein-tyrosine kinase